MLLSWPESQKGTRSQQKTPSLTGWESRTEKKKKKQHASTYCLCRYPAIDTVYQVERGLLRSSQNGSPLKRPIAKHKYKVCFWLVFLLLFYFCLAEGAVTAGVVRSPAGSGLFEQQHWADYMEWLTEIRSDLCFNAVETRSFFFEYQNLRVQDVKPLERCIRIQVTIFLSGCIITCQIQDWLISSRVRWDLSHQCWDSKTTTHDPSWRFYCTGGGWG